MGRQPEISLIATATPPITCIPHLRTCPEAPRTHIFPVQPLPVEETTGPAQAVPTSETGPSWFANQNLRHSQVLLREWRWKDTKGPQRAEINWQNADAWPISHPLNHTVQLRPSCIFPSPPATLTSTQWLRITGFYHQIIQSRNLGTWYKIVEV